MISFGYVRILKGLRVHGRPEKLEVSRAGRMGFWCGRQRAQAPYGGKQEGPCYQKLKDQGEVECGSL
jgi:hypothetical protein